MTGYTVHTGSNQKFTAGWDQIFQGAGRAKKSAASAGAGRKKVATPTKAAKKKGVARKGGAKKS